jgi:glycerol kinase
MFVVEGAVNGAGSAVGRVGAELGFGDPEIAARADEWLARPGRRPLFLNGVSGLGSPYWIAHFESRFVGSGKPWERIVAVYESIVFLIQINLEEMTKEVGPAREILLAGGLSALDGLCRRIADLSGLTVIRSGLPEATTRGAAFLVAGMPAGWSEPTGATRFAPTAQPELEQRFRRWRRELEARLR